jgi:hypothetical protein
MSLPTFSILWLAGTIVCKFLFQYTVWGDDWPALCPFGKFRTWVFGQKEYWQAGQVMGFKFG